MTELLRGNGRDGHKHETKRRQSGSESRRRTHLFLRGINGEPQQFAVLVEELSALLSRRLRSNAKTRALANNAADIEDVLQETFLRLWQHRHRFDASRAIEAWAWVIARNVAVDLLRRRSRTTPATPLLEAVADRRAVEPSAGLTDEEKRQAFTAALERETNPLVRRVLELRLVAGLSYGAVSQATGVPVGTVATWVGRLRRWLRDQALRGKADWSPLLLRPGK